MLFAHFYNSPGTLVIAAVCLLYFYRRVPELKATLLESCRCKFCGFRSFGGTHCPHCGLPRFSAVHREVFENCVKRVQRVLLSVIAATGCGILGTALAPQWGTIGFAIGFALGWIAALAAWAALHRQLR